MTFKVLHPVKNNHKKFDRALITAEDTPILVPNFPK